jgi:hypothetical protein
MYAAAGPLDVGSLWLDRYQNLKENFRVFFYSRSGKTRERTH